MRRTVSWPAWAVGLVVGALAGCASPPTGDQIPQRQMLASSAPRDEWFPPDANGHPDTLAAGSSSLETVASSLTGTRPIFDASVRATFYYNAAKAEIDITPTITIHNHEDIGAPGKIRQFSVPGLLQYAGDTLERAVSAECGVVLTGQVLFLAWYERNAVLQGLSRIPKTIPTRSGPACTPPMVYLSSMPDSIAAGEILGVSGVATHGTGGLESVKITINDSTVLSVVDPFPSWNGSLTACGNNTIKLIAKDSLGFSSATSADVRVGNCDNYQEGAGSSHDDCPPGTVVYAWYHFFNGGWIYMGDVCITAGGPPIMFFPP